MATDISTVEFLAEQSRGAGNITYKKMFGEYMIYCNGKPIFLICDDTLYVKMLPELQEMLKDAPTGNPYNGAKPHYIIEDIDNSVFMCGLASALEKLIPLPKPKKKKTI